MPRCCQGASCACRIEAGANIVVTGSGSSQDPFVIAANVGIGAQDNTTFNVTVHGSGTALDPYLVEVTYAATAKLDDLPDVQAPSPTNGQVLGWDNALARWTPRAPTTAAAGSVLHDTTLTGDGSAGAPLGALLDSARGMVSGASGFGLSDAAINQTVRKFTDATARAAATPVPTLNSLSMLDSTPGVVEFWNGTGWEQVEDELSVDVVGEFLALSGPYGGTERLTMVLRQIDTFTDVAGVFTVLDAATIAAYSGLVSVQFQETGSLSWKAVVYPNVDHVEAIAYQLSDGAIYPGINVTGTVMAWAY